MRVAAGIQPDVAAKACQQVFCIDGVSHEFTIVDSSWHGKRKSVVPRRGRISGSLVARRGMGILPCLEISPNHERDAVPHSARFKIHRQSGDARAATMLLPIARKRIILIH
jgi:hypothetical protein